MSYGWLGEYWIVKLSVILSLCLCVVLISVWNDLSVLSCGCMVVWLLLGELIVYGLLILLGLVVRLLLWFLCVDVLIGWIGGKYSMLKFMLWMCGKCVIMLLNVLCWCGLLFVECGNILY